MFAAEFEPAEMNGSGRRRAPRAPVSLNARLGQGGMARTLCKVTDLSIHGARLQTYSSLRKGSTIWLTLPTIGLHAADVMWADDFTAGCQFHKPLEIDPFERLLALTGG